MLTFNLRVIAVPSGPVTVRLIRSSSGVQRSAFPDLVPELNDPNNVESNAPFDTTVNQFDNAVYVFSEQHSTTIVALR